MTAKSAIEAFAAEVAPERTDGEIELDRAALLIAAPEYPELDLPRYLGKLDALADRLLVHLKPDAGPLETARLLQRVLGADEGFRGNLDDYYDASNSYLNEVLDRRVGIPITLSVVYIEVARRVSLELEGIGFPGHFLVRHQGLVLDPFEGGRVLSEIDLRDRLERLSNGTLRFGPRLMASVDKRQILYRMLANLKSIHINARDPARGLAAVDRMLLLSPDAALDHRDRALCLARLERPVEALSALKRYRELSPNARDGEEIDAMAAKLRAQIGFSN